MYSFVFRNKLAALAFVLLMLVGIATLIGTEDNEGIIAQTTVDIAQAQSKFDETVDRVGTGEERPTIMGPAPPAADIPLADDAQLIDKATGIDPTPVDPSDPKAIAETDTLVIVRSDEPARR